MVPSLYPKTYLSKEKFSGSFIVGFWNLYGGFLYHPPPPTKKKLSKVLAFFANQFFFTYSDEINDAPSPIVTPPYPLESRFEHILIYPTWRCFHTI